jgi:hypothetical protein
MTHSKQKKFTKRKPILKGQHGGIRIKGRPLIENLPLNLDSMKNTFWNFFKNSEISIFSTRTRGGILFEVKLNPVQVSPYELCRSNEPFQAVKTLLFKMVIFSEEGLRLLIDESTTIDLNRCSSKDFYHEVNLQYTMFTNTLDNCLEPICPSVVYCENMTLDNFLEQCETIDNKTEKTRKTIFFLNQLKNNINKWDDETNPIFIGIIVMEKMEGFITLYEAIKTTKSHYEYVKLHLLAFFELIRLYEQGYLHGDFHLNNMLVKINYEYIRFDMEISEEIRSNFENYIQFIENFKNSFSGRVILIDFGASFKPTKVIDINENRLELVLQENYRYASPLWGDIDVSNFPSYTWMNNFFEPGDINKNVQFVNLMLKEMRKGRELVKTVFLERLGDIPSSASTGGGIDLINKDTALIGDIALIEKYPNEKIETVIYDKIPNMKNTKMETKIQPLTSEEQDKIKLKTEILKTKIKKKFDEIFEVNTQTLSDVENIIRDEKKYAEIIKNEITLK